MASIRSKHTNLQSHPRVSGPLGLGAADLGIAGVLLLGFVLVMVRHEA